MQRLLLIFSLIIILVFLLRLLLTPEGVLEFARQYQDFSSVHTIATCIIIVLFYAVAFALTIPITTVLALLTGFLFGFLPAFILLVIATIIGALSIFYGTKLYPQSLCKIFIGTNYQKLLGWAEERPVSFMLATRFAPLVPFPIVHIIPAEANVRPIDFLWTTLLGTVPATAFFIAIGSGSRILAAGESLMARPYLIALTLFLIVVLLALYITKRKNFKNGIQETQKMRPNQKVVRRETTDE